LRNILSFMVDKIKMLLFLIWYKRHLKRRIEINNFGRREEW